MFAAAPPMPIHSEPATAYAVYTALMIVITASILVYSRASATERARGWLLPLLLAGGAISAVCEPLFDNLILYWYPPDHSFEAFELWDRSVPWFVPIGYAWYCGALPYAAFRIFQRGVMPKQVWQMLGVVVTIDALAISTAGWLNTSGFYGNQPFNVWSEYPLWWAAIDGAHVIVGGAVLLFLVPRLEGRSRLALLAIPTMVLGMVCGVCAWPIALALNSDASDLGAYAGGSLTIALGLSLIWAAMKYVTGSSRVLQDGLRRELSGQLTPSLGWQPAPPK